MNAYQISSGLVETLIEGLYALQEKDQKFFENGEMSLTQLTIRKEEQETALKFLNDLIKDGEEQAGAEK